MLIYNCTLSCFTYVYGESMDYVRTHSYLRFHLLLSVSYCLDDFYAMLCILLLF